MQSLGIVETKYYTFAYGPDRLRLESGEGIGPITIAYETYGRLNKNRTNAILILHALSGDANAAGFHANQDKPGWWNDMIGPDKAFDTTKYFVICSNVLGGCRGSTGPSSINPETKKPYALSFPLITIRDMVKCQRHLIDYFGIEKLLCAAGGSMGGMQVLAWMTDFPERIRSAIPIATALRHSAQQIAFNEVGRQAIMADPNWTGGNYYGHRMPSGGLSIARMVGHITYMSDMSMSKKFGRLRTGEFSSKFLAGFEVEKYLHYRGNSFVKRFDANSYLYITKAMDMFDAIENSEKINNLKKFHGDVLVIAFKSDWLYPAYQSKEIVRVCKHAGINVSYCEIESTYGHDAFLLEVNEQTRLIKNFLNKIFSGTVYENQAGNIS
ncbi:MAG: homoserine O-acetyltransferase [Candidatus Omnitrophica bacterium]|nr:homoserine O-acetyltransferase [Candidatus Omnitrophota bacterium]